MTRLEIATRLAAGMTDNNRNPDVKMIADRALDMAEVLLVKEQERQRRDAQMRHEIPAGTPAYIPPVVPTPVDPKTEIMQTPEIKTPPQPVPNPQQ